MDSKTAKQLQIGDRLYYKYAQCTVQSNLKHNGGENYSIDVLRVNDHLLERGAPIQKIFLPTKRVIEASDFVAKKKKDLDQILKNRSGEKINPNTIIELFDKYWIMMCNANDHYSYCAHKVWFNTLIEKLFKVSK